MTDSPVSSDEAPSREELAELIAAILEGKEKLLTVLASACEVPRIHFAYAAAARQVAIGRWLAANLPSLLDARERVGELESSRLLWDTSIRGAWDALADVRAQVTAEGERAEKAERCVAELEAERDRLLPPPSSGFASGKVRHVCGLQGFGQDPADTCAACSLAQLTALRERAEKAERELGEWRARALSHFDVIDRFIEWSDDEAIPPAIILPSDGE